MLELILAILQARRYEEAIRKQEKVIEKLEKLVGKTSKSKIPRAGSHVTKYSYKPWVHIEILRKLQLNRAVYTDPCVLQTAVATRTRC